MLINEWMCFCFSVDLVFGVFVINEDGIVMDIGGNK